MPTIALQAHYDGERIVLDEPFPLPPNANLLVTLLPASTEIDAEDRWMEAVKSSDAFAFLANPAEDIYSAVDGKPLDDAA